MEHHKQHAVCYLFVYSYKSVLVHNNMCFYMDDIMIIYFIETLIILNTKVLGLKIHNIKPANYYSDYDTLLAKI